MAAVAWGWTRGTWRAAMCWCRPQQEDLPPGPGPSMSPRSGPPPKLAPQEKWGHQRLGLIHSSGEMARVSGAGAEAFHTTAPSAPGSLHAGLAWQGLSDAQITC